MSFAGADGGAGAGASGGAAAAENFQVSREHSQQFSIFLSRFRQYYPLTPPGTPKIVAELHTEPCLTLTYNSPSCCEER